MAVRRKTITFISLLIVIIGTGSLIAYALVLGFTEDLNFKRWSVAYILFTPSFIEHLPRPKIIGDVVYYHSNGDGPKPPAEGLSFETIATKGEILSKFAAYLSQNGYVEDKGKIDVLEYQYSKNQTKFYFSVQAIENGKNLVVAQECYFN
jgi:hypothetical protein